VTRGFMGPLGGFWPKLGRKRVTGWKQRSCVPPGRVKTNKQTKGYLKVEKKSPWESSFPMPLRDRKVEKNFPREMSFPPLHILFFPGTIFFSGTRQTKMFTWDKCLNGKVKSSAKCSTLNFHFNNFSVLAGKESIHDTNSVKSQIMQVIISY
jgi:hypothetical protein